MLASSGFPWKSHLSNHTVTSAAFFSSQLIWAPFEQYKKFVNIENWILQKISHFPESSREKLNETQKHHLKCRPVLTLYYHRGVIAQIRWLWKIFQFNFVSSSLSKGRIVKVKKTQREIPNLNDFSKFKSSKIRHQIRKKITYRGF